MIILRIAALVFMLSLLSLTVILANSRPDNPMPPYLAYSVAGDIWMMGTDGSVPPQQITQDNYIKRGLTWSGGLDLVYVADISSVRTLMRWHNGQSQPILEMSDRIGTLVFSPDGQHAAGYAYREVQQFDLRNRSVQSYDMPCECSAMVTMWSPDRAGPSFMGRAPSGNLHWFRLDKGDHSTALSQVGGRFSAPLFAPDESAMVYQNFGRNAGLTIQPFDAPAYSLIETDVAEWPTWSPDGAWIIFLSNLEGDSMDLYRIRPDGTDLQRLTDTPKTERRPSWSQDGQWLAFTSGNAIGYIERIRIDGSEHLSLPNGSRIPIDFGSLAWSPVIDLEWSPLWALLSSLGLLFGLIRGRKA